ncbi:MAG: hypothetical protein ACRCUT_06095 [Spirochaetota bacterium]
MHYNHISSRFRLFIFLISAFFIAALGIIDSLTGNDISLAALYIFPLFLVSRYLNHLFGILFSVLCAAVIIFAAVSAG